MKSFLRKMIAGFMSVALVVGLMPSVALASGGEKLSVVSLTTQASAMDETEPNDDFDEATKISMNRWVYAQQASSDDVDYYTVTLPASGSVKITFVNGKHRNDTWDCFYATIYDKYYREVDYWDWSSLFYTAPESKSFSLKQGVNYLKIDNADYSNQPYHFKLTYNIPTTTVTKITATKKAFTAKWTKKSGTAKYQLRYSVNKNMSNAKTINVSNRYASKKVTNLKAKRKYWVQVRVAKKIGGQTYWSPWSGRKAVTTKAA